MKNTWKWAIALLLFFSLLVPVAATAADPGDPADQDQAAGPGDPAGGDDEPGDDPAGDDPPADDEEPGEDPPADPEEPADDADLVNAQPSYTNAAQAMHAANLAAAAAQKADPQTLQAADDLASARQTYNDAKEAALADPENEQLQEAVELAYGELLQARDTYAAEISSLTGVMEGEVMQLRQSGMGWGSIAHELGVHPGVLGLARGKKKGQLAQPLDPVEGELQIQEHQTVQTQAALQNEIAEATQRNAKNGWSRGHGLKTGNSGSSQKGLGLSESSATAQNSGGIKGNSSKGSKGASSKGTGASGAAAAKSNNGRASDGGPSNSSKGKGAGNSNNGKSGKSNNGKGNGKNK